jgi:F0F1-type ATP synthase epsilon subunit
MQSVLSPQLRTGFFSVGGKVFVKIFVETEKSKEDCSQDERLQAKEQSHRKRKKRKTEKWGLFQLCNNLHFAWLTEINPSF